MIETSSLQPDSEASDSNSGSTAQEIRERTERLQRKVGDLSKTFDQIEKTLAEAGEESDERASKK